MASCLSASAEMQYQRRCTAVVRCALLLLFVACLSSSSVLPAAAQLPGQCTTATCWIEVEWGAPDYWGPPGGCGTGGQVGSFFCTGFNATTGQNNTRPMTDCWNNFLTPLAIPATSRSVNDFDCVEWQLTTPLSNCSGPCNTTGTWTRKLECIDTTQTGTPSVDISICDRANLTRPNTTVPCIVPCAAEAMEITFAVWQDPFQRVTPQSFPGIASPAIFATIPLGMATRLVITKGYVGATASWALVASPNTKLQMLTNKGSGDVEAMVSTNRTVAGSDTLEITISFAGQTKTFSIGLQWAISNNAYLSALRILDPSPYMQANGFPLVSMIDANSFRFLDFNVPNSFVVSQNFDLLLDYDVLRLVANFTMQSSFTTSSQNNITVNAIGPQVFGDSTTTPSFAIKTNADAGSKLTYNFRVRRLAAVPAGMAIWAGAYNGEFAPSVSWTASNHFNYTVILPRDRLITECFLYMPLALEYLQSDSPLVVIRFSVGLLPVTDKPTLASLPRYKPSDIQNITLPTDFGNRGWTRVWVYIYGDASCDNNAADMLGRFCYPFAPKIWSAKFKRVGREATMALDLSPAPLQVNTPFLTPCANLSTPANPDLWNCSDSEFTYSNTGIPRGTGLGLSFCASAYAGGQRNKLELYQPGGLTSVFNLTLNDDDDASGFALLPQLANAPCATGEVLLKVPGDKFLDGRNKVLFKLSSEDKTKHVVYTVYINKLPAAPSSSSGVAAAMSSSGANAMAASSSGPAAAAASSSAAADVSSSAAAAAVSSSAAAAPAMSSSAPAILSSSAPAMVSSSAAGAQSSSASMESSTGPFVPPVAVVVAVVPQRTDPCTTALNPCMWNSRCESALTPNSTVVADPNMPVSKTMRCFCLPGFFGDGCSIGILTRALTSTPAGNLTLRVLMVGAQAIRAMTVGMSHRIIDFAWGTLSADADADTLDIVSNHPSADVRALSSVETLTFTSPSYWDLFPAGYTPASYAPQTFVSMALSSDDEAGEFGLPATRKLLQSGGSTGTAVMPAVRSGYQTLRFFAQFATGSTATGTVTRGLNATNLLYYSASNCISVNAPDSWPMRDGSCGPCPEGCNCVGGGRCWPLPGYWSWNERQLPVACSYPEACPGVNAAAMIASDGTINTQTCSDGYTGAGCTQCDDNHYQLNSRCYSCGSTDQTAQMVAIVFAAVLVTLSLAVGVVTLSPLHLVHLVTAFVLLQQISVIGAQGANNIPGKAGPALATFFSFVSVVNFDLQILRPGCSVPSFSFLALFMGTIGLILFTALLFLVACSLRYLFMQALSQNGLILSAHSKLDEQSRLEATRRVLEVAKEDPLKAAMRAGLFSISPLEDFRRRFSHSMLILCTIFFLKLTTLQMRLFVCVMAPAPADALTADETTELQLLLKADLQTRCYTGSHLVCIIIALVLFVVYTLGFPLAVFVLLTRKFADEHTKGIVGWLRLHFSILRPAMSKAEERSQARDKLELQEVAAQRTLSTAATMPRAASVDDKVSAWQTDVRKPSTLRLASAAGLTPSMQRKLAYLWVEHSRICYYAIFFLDIRTEYFPYRLSTFLTNFAFVLVTTLVINIQRQLFALGMVFAFDAVVVSWCLPYKRWTLNLRSGLIAVLLVAQNGVLLGVQNDSSAEGGPGSAFFIVLVCVFAMLCVLLAARDPIMRAIARCTGLKIRSSRDEPKHTTKVQPYAVTKGLRTAGENSSSGPKPGGDRSPRNEYADSEDDDEQEHSGGGGAGRVVAVNEHEREVELARVVASEERRARNEAAEAAAHMADNLSRMHGSDLSDGEDQVSSVEASPRKSSIRKNQAGGDNLSPRLAAPAPPSSHLPPSWSFPQDTPIQPSLMLANALSGLTASARTVASASVVAAPGQTGSQIDWATAPLSADDLAASSAQLLTALCADRDPTQVALLQAVWKNPVLSSAAEQQLADLVTTVGQLRDDVTSLLDEERASAAEVKAQAARIAGMQSLVEIRPATPARVEGMVQHLLTKQRPDLNETCVQHLLNHEADFAPQLDDLVRSANEHAEGAAASASSAASSSSPSSSIAALSLQQSLTRTGLNYFKSAAQLCRPGDSKTLAMYSTVSNRLARNQALLSTAASALATHNFAAADASYAAAGMSRHSAAQGLPALKPRAVTDTAALGFRSFLQQTAASRAKRVHADSSPLAGSVAASTKPAGKSHGRKPSAAVIAAAAVLSQGKGSPMGKPAPAPAPGGSPSSSAEIAPPSPEHSML